MSEVVVEPGPFRFDVGSPDADAAVLCLHGLTGTPYEIRPVGEALARAGFAVDGPALPGHASTAEALAAVERFEVWLDAARAAADRLRERHRRVYACGLSMGGLLSLALAAEARVDALAVIGTPLRLPLPVRLAVPWLWRLRRFQEKDGGSDIQDEAARRRHPSLPVMPLRAVAHLVALQRHVDAALERIVQPIFVGHGSLDRTARPADADEIARRVSSASHSIRRYERSGHVVPVDHDGPRLAADVVAFFDGQRGATGRRPGG